MKITVNDTVEYRGRVGKVERIFNYVALVRIEDELVKCDLNDLVKVEPHETAKEEIPEGAKRITAEDFRHAVIKATSSFGIKNDNVLGGLTGTIVAAEIGLKLFDSRDSVIMTKDEFIVTLWNGCSPESIKAGVGGQMPLDESLTVSISSINALRDLPDILFDKSDDD